MVDSPSKLLMPVPTEVIEFKIKTGLLKGATYSYRPYLRLQGLRVIGERIFHTQLLKSLILPSLHLGISGLVGIEFLY